MKKTTLLLFAAAGCMALASCLKEPVDGLRLVAEPFQNESKMAVSAADGITLNFAEGDQVWINGTTCTVNAGGSLSETFDEAIYAVYPAGILVENSFNQGAGTASVNIGGTDGIYHYRKDASGNQLLDVPMVAYADANATELKFRHLTAALTVKITNSTANTITLESVEIENRGPHRLWGTVTDVNLTTPSVAEVADDAKKTVQMVFVIDDDEKNLEIPSGSYAYVQIPILPAVSDNGDYNTMQVEVQARNKIDGIVNSILLYHRRQTESSTFSILQNQLARVPADIDLNDSYNFSGAFTIDAAGNKVFFSKSNLRYNITSSTWSFADEQYNIVEPSNSTNYDKDLYDNHPGVEDAAGNKWMDLFLYGATGYDGFNPRTLPYYARANLLDKLALIQNSINTTDNDWGKYCMGGGSQWYTPTKDQWDYMLNTRQMQASNCDRYKTAYVHGLWGIMLFPDDYRKNSNDIWPIATVNNVANVINPTNGQWDAMELRGCVFLPAAGYLMWKDPDDSQYNGVDNRNQACFYWTSSSYYLYCWASDGSAPTLTNADDNTYYKSSGRPMPYNCAVRLVHPAQAGSSK